MIASADFFATTETMESNAGLELPYSDDRLVPGADPYIAQLVVDHVLEVAAERALADANRLPVRARFDEMQLALA